jgi:hypothetical protein
MAQESRITSFEKALKDEGIAGTNLEPVARSIFQQESSSGANVKTSNAGARGPMQVLPATFKAYNPQGNIDDPYDNSVGGLRYIKDLFSKTNDPGLTAVGYYGGPKAIEKAKQGIAVSDPRNPNAPNTLQYMEQVMGRTKGSQAQPTPRGSKPPVNPLIKQKITDLGPSYQAALALMAKADDLSEAREKIAEEEELASAGADFSQAKQMLAQIKPTSPFPAQEPRRMAGGGEAKIEEGLDPSLRFQSIEKPKDFNLEPGVYQQGPQGMVGRAGFEYRGEGSSYRGGASAVAIKLPDGSIKIIPAAYDVGYSTKIGPGELELSANRAMKAAPGRNPEWGARVNYRIPIGKAEGGEVEKKPEPSMGEKVKGTAKEILRSTQYTPYDLLGAPVDVINLGLKGVDYVTGSKLATEKPVGGSDYLIQKSRELGIADKPTGSTTETLTRLGTGIISPTAGPRAVVAAGQAVKGTAKAALEDLAMASTGQGGSNLAQKIMAPGTAFAVRPKGGVYLGAKSIEEPPLSNFDIHVRHFTEDLDRTDPQQAEVVKFIDKKLRNYVMNDMGTADDPIFKKMLSGEIPNYTYASADEFAAAQAGDKNALKNVRNAYDSSISLNAYVGEGQAKALGKGNANSYLLNMEKALRKKIKEQSPDSPTELMTSVNRISTEQLEKYPRLYSAPGFKQMAEESEAGALMRMMNQSDLPPHVRKAVAEGEPIFASTNSGPRGVLDMIELRDYLLTRNPNDIKNMGVADAIAKSKQWHARMEAARRDPSKFSPKVLFEGTKELLPVGEGYKWVDVKTPDALSLEGNIMGHCVGGSGYCNAVAKQNTKIISLRDQKGVPHVTIELQKDQNGSFSRIAQIKGTGNNSPEKYFNEVDAFLKDYSAKLGGELSITERPNFVPPDWRYK